MSYKLMRTQTSALSTLLLLKPAISHQRISSRAAYSSLARSLKISCDRQTSPTSSTVTLPFRSFSTSESSSEFSESSTSSSKPINSHQYQHNAKSESSTSSSSSSSSESSHSNSTYSDYRSAVPFRINSNDAKGYFDAWLSQHPLAPSITNLNQKQCYVPFYVVKGDVLTEWVAHFELTAKQVKGEHHFANGSEGSMIVNSYSTQFHSSLMASASYDFDRDLTQALKVDFSKARSADFALLNKSIAICETNVPIESVKFTFEQNLRKLETVRLKTNIASHFHMPLAEIDLEVKTSLNEEAISKIYFPCHVFSYKYGSRTFYVVVSGYDGKVSAQMIISFAKSSLMVAMLLSPALLSWSNIRGFSTLPYFLELLAAELGLPTLCLGVLGLAWPFILSQYTQANLESQKEQDAKCATIKASRMAEIDANWKRIQKSIEWERRHVFGANPTANANFHSWKHREYHSQHEWIGGPGERFGDYSNVSFDKEYVSDPKGLYSVLNVSRTATAAEIKAAFHREAKLHHPDRHEVTTDAINQRFNRISQAWHVLRDPHRRRIYDSSGVIPR